ncbi:MAG: 4Fe-4S dicluster domain-containing protein [Deltaproteobacteria bacterium]|nr:4Fe-4S dicluster domain-containing protein [Deltaproteobacteria bacterium]
MPPGFEQLKKNVIQKGLCTGCGTCVGLCPQKALEVVYMDGEPEPKLSGKCIPCGLCSEVCAGASIPLADMDQWLFGRKGGFKNHPLGIYRKCLRGYSTNSKIRASSSSGGATSAILNYALEKGVIEAAIVASADPQRPWRCVPFLATSTEELKKASRFTAEMVGVNSLLRETVVEKGFKKIAIVGMPCHIHSLRKIQMAKRPGEIARAIKLTLGLFCASTYYFEGIKHLLSEFAGIDQLQEVVSLDYKGGAWPGSLTAATKDGKIHHVATKHEYTWHFLGPGSKRDRCLMCPDFSARVADIATGDIFQKVSSDPNINAILVRTKTGEEVVKQAVKAGFLSVENHPPEFVPKSGLGWESKEHANIHRMKFRKRFGWPLPDYQYPVEMCHLPGKLVFP